MNDKQVIESFDNAWRALCKEYEYSPSDDVRTALNQLGKIITKVKSAESNSKKTHQIEIEEWLKFFLEVENA